MAYETIKLNKDGRVAYLTLNRPQAMNAMDDTMMEELAMAFEDLQQDEKTQVVVMNGEGRAFSAGGDIKKMADPDQPMDIEKVMVYVSRLSKALYSLPQITIASIHGAAAGLGFSMALGCDYIIAEENSKLAMNFIGIGLVPDGGGHFFLKERIGTPAAKQMIWTGDVLTAEEAAKRGLCDTVVPAGKLSEGTQAIVQKLLSSPIRAMMASKEILHAAKLQELGDVLKMESKQQALMRKSKDHLEGIRAFIEKRKPEFTGE